MNFNCNADALPRLRINEQQRWKVSTTGWMYLIKSVKTRFDDVAGAARDATRLVG